MERSRKVAGRLRQQSEEVPHQRLWLKKARSMNLPVSGPLLAEKALTFAAQLNCTGFACSNGWLSRFKARYSIVGKAVCGEAAAADEEVNFGTFRDVDGDVTTSPDFSDSDIVAAVAPRPASSESKWKQILGAFGARSNVKAVVLAKIIVDVVICAEKSGLFVDFVTCEGAVWNRSMWKIFGVSGKLEKTVCKVKHPVDSSRYLHFLSDFPHLVKCVRNAVTFKGLLTPDDRVSNEYVKEACKCNTSSSVTLRAMPHITMTVCQPNGFEKMRVNLAITFFSDEVLRSLYVYNSQVEHCYGTDCTKATSAFVSMMRDLIDAMTSRYSKRGLRPDSKEVASIKHFPEFLTTWEKAVPKQGGFLSESTAKGLRVTLTSTLSILLYVTKTLGLKYLMTSRLCQDPFENLFGILRQMFGSNDHPTPT
ncbi:hypothetical protein HPB49_026002 [Dermacentor silvarum]|nr:hypothetical protein HPB49_026002 [Dermacentor silvarum]